VALSLFSLSLSSFSVRDKRRDLLSLSIQKRVHPAVHAVEREEKRGGRGVKRLTNLTLQNKHTPLCVGKETLVSVDQCET
jgi:hypothetical protein